MSAEIDKSIIDRVKEALNLAREMTDSQLYENLSRAVADSHPDKYKDESARL